MWHWPISFFFQFCFVITSSLKDWLNSHFDKNNTYDLADMLGDFDMTLTSFSIIVITFLIEIFLYNNVA